MSQALRKSNPVNPPNFDQQYDVFLVQEYVVSDHPPIIRSIADEEGYVNEIRVRDGITTATQVNTIHRHGVRRLYGTQGINPNNGGAVKVKERHNVWACGTGSTSSAWS